jgi:hypothetical protein
VGRLPLHPPGITCKAAQLVQHRGRVGVARPIGGSGGIGEGSKLSV